MSELMKSICSNLPDCMMPDGGPPCAGYDHLLDEAAKWKELAALHEELREGCLRQNAELRQENNQLREKLRETVEGELYLSVSDQQPKAEDAQASECVACERGAEGRRPIPTDEARKALEEEQVRQAFEHWFSDEGKSNVSIQRDASGNYVLSLAHLQWTAWKAAFAALSLPKTTGEDGR